MPAKKSAKASWPAQVQMIKNAVAADRTSQKKTSAASKRKSTQFTGNESKGFGQNSSGGKRTQARRDAK